jgi:hypothetical protein
MTKLGKPATAKNSAVKAKNQLTNSKTVKIKGQPHEISKNKASGDIIVNHPGSSQKAYKKIDLTKKAGVKTVKAGVKATKDWHKKNG